METCYDCGNELTVKRNVYICFECGWADDADEWAEREHGWLAAMHADGMEAMQERAANAVWGIDD